MILIPVSSFRAKREIFVIHGQGLTFSPYVPRTSLLSSSVFHAARTLSGSLRSPPSPRGEGFVRRYSFSTYACIRSDVMGKAVFSYRSLPRMGKGGPRQRRSGTFVYRLLETISTALFHPAFPIQPPPLRGTSFHRKEGVSTLAPSLGRGCRAQRGGVGSFLRRSRLLFVFPIGKGGPRQRRSGTFVNGALETHFSTRFHTARALSAHSGRAFIQSQGAAHPTG